ncbi:PP2C family protein-serine/threonine phosphatase [Caballeronia humi]|uniref:Serine/threonine phosphatase stp n=1 Tax=Caballeronia humi TaxID=326474 RepID=A0A158G7S0_9BURK|nr:protein phosphatase 2C domain-containing protein [Caballeronia humi]SAL27903.1 Serine/threonine phosphatase stp [Caballeronia humi]
MRTENQDRMSWVRARAGDIFVVSDGMGGHAGGALAAQLTVETLQQKLADLASLDSAAATLESAFQAANDAVFVRGQSSNPATARMGATAVALLAAGNQVMLAHVGDSRAYLLDRRGTLQRLTKDHSLVQRMVDAKVLSEAQAANHPDASVLERAMGQAARVEVEVSGWVRVHPGEACMLCSDGLCGYVEDDDIAAVMRSGHAAQQTADELVRLALERGGEDNVTVQVLHYGARQAPWRRWAVPGAIGGALAALAALALGPGWSGMHATLVGAGDGARHASDAVPAQTALTPAAVVAPPIPPASTSASAATALPGASAPGASTSMTTRSGTSAAVVSANGASHTAALPASPDARFKALEMRIQQDATNQRAAENELNRKLDELRGRIDQMEKRLNAESHASAPSASHAHATPRADSAKKTQPPARTASAKVPAASAGAESAAETKSATAAAPPPGATAAAPAASAAPKDSPEGPP